MTPARFRTCLDMLHISLRGLAPMLGCSDGLTRCWSIGKYKVPPRIADWLEACVKTPIARPLPKVPRDWRSRPAILVKLAGETMPLSVACKLAGIKSMTSVRFMVERYGISHQAAFNHLAMRRSTARKSPPEE